jgi:pyrophosphatase PpaX
MAEPSNTVRLSNILAKNLNGVIFDMDGTLVSTLPLIVHCLNEIVEKYLSRKLTLEEVISTFGPAAREIIRRFTVQLGEIQSKSAIEDYYGCYRRELPRRALLFPGIEELLAKLQNSGKRLAVFTGVERVLMELTLDSFGLRKYFQVLVAGDDVRNSKPDPEGVWLALNKMKLRPKESAIIGDSPADILAGKGAGVVTIAALWSPENRGDPTTENPDFQFRSVSELSRFFFPEERKEEPSFYFSPGLGR